MSNTPEREGIIRILCDATHLNWSRPDLEDAADKILAEDRATLRDQFAMAAMAGDWAREHGFRIVNSASNIPFYGPAEAYYKMADAMMEARKQ